MKRLKLGYLHGKEAVDAMLSFNGALIEATGNILDFNGAFWLHVLRENLNATLSYTLPKFTLRDHLKECYGWLCCGVSP